MLKTPVFSALGLALTLSATSIGAQDATIPFPEITADAPTQVGFVSLLNADQRAALASALDRADTEGFFPEEVEARGADPARMILYLLPSWKSASGIPDQALPPVAKEIVTKLPASFFRYALPLRTGEGEPLAMVFYIAPSSSEAMFTCVAEDLVNVLKSAFKSTEGTDCSQR